jgi:hypothetical protein
VRKMGHTGGSRHGGRALALRHDGSCDRATLKNRDSFYMSL